MLDYTEVKYRFNHECDTSALSTKVIELINAAIDKEIPYKPEYKADITGDYARFCNCGAELGFAGDVSYLPKVCPNCGQILDWSSEV